MGLGIWFSEDIRNAILAADKAAITTTKCFAEAMTRNQEIHPVETVAEIRGFGKGYKAALDTIAVAFGIAPQAITSKDPHEPYKIESPPEWILPYGTHDEST